MPFSKPAKPSDTQLRHNKIKGELDNLKTQLSRCDGEWNMISKKVIFRGFIHNEFMHHQHHH